jgi:glycosyltransferase involved in cell wall biosynthesis
MDSAPIPDIGIKWDARFLSWSGYSNAARQYAFSLDQAGLPIQAGIIKSVEEGFLETVDAKTRLRLERMAQRKVPRDILVASCVPFLESDMYSFLRLANPGFRYYVGYTVFETDRIPSTWAAPCNGMDEIWVPSRFNCGTFERAGVLAEKLRAIPHSLDTGLFDPQATRPAVIPGRRGFCFLSVFEWSRRLRKGWDVLVRAYANAFSRTDDVSLLVHARNTPLEAVHADAAQSLASAGKTLNDCAPILVSEQPLDDAGMAGLYRGVDAFVLPSRGEGWGIPYMEAMAMGLPTIGTRWSGNLDFMDDANSYLIDGALADIPDAVSAAFPLGQMLYQGHRWAEPSVSETARLMREVYDRREASRSRGAKAREHIVRHFDNRTVARLLIRELERIRNSPPFRSRPANPL